MNLRCSLISPGMALLRAASGLFTCLKSTPTARGFRQLTFLDSKLRDPVYPDLRPQFKEPDLTRIGGGDNWYQPVDAKLINKVAPRSGIRIRKRIA